MIESPTPEPVPPPSVPGAPGGIERRGMDAAVIALISQLHNQFVDSHAKVHEDFVESHHREHGLEGDSAETALDLAAQRFDEHIEALRLHYDTILNERNQRYEERYQASQIAVAAAFDAREKALKEAFDAREKALLAALEAKDKAVASAFEASEKAISKAEVSIEKRADATYVALGELQRLLSQLMPRAEAENRFGNQDATIGDIKERVGRMESIKAGSKEAFTNVQMFLGILLALLVVGGYIVGTR